MKRLFIVTVEYEIAVCAEERDEAEALAELHVRDELPCVHGYDVVNVAKLYKQQHNVLPYVQEGDDDQRTCLEIVTEYEAWAKQEAIDAEAAARQLVLFP